MALIQRIHQPNVGLIPIGDRFTMGPETAALACNEFLDLEVIVPIHWGTFDLLSGDPADLQVARQARPGRDPEPGSHSRCSGRSLRLPEGTAAEKDLCRRTRLVAAASCLSPRQSCPISTQALGSPSGEPLRHPISERQTPRKAEVIHTNVPRDVPNLVHQPVD